MNKSFNFGFIAIIAIVAGLYWLVDNEYVYKYERYYLGDSLSTKNILVSRKPEFVEGNLFRSAHYNIKDTVCKCRFRVAEGSLKQLIKDKAVAGIAGLKANDSITIQFRSADESSMADSTGKVRIIGLTQNNKLVIDPAQVAKIDKENYHLNMGIGAILLLIGIIWQVANSFKKKVVVPEAA